jgi:hypothetical protein
MRQRLRNGGEDSDAFTDTEAPMSSHQVEEGPAAGVLHEDRRALVGGDNALESQKVGMVQSM